MKYRTKPVIIEAEQYLEKNDVLPFQDEDVLQYHEDGYCQYIETPEGWLTVNDGDWIIRGIRGEFYPCRNDIFKATYEPVE